MNGFDEDRLKAYFSSERMDITLPLDRMSTAEKLRAMEALWTDLSRNEAELDSPAWHDQIREQDEKFKTSQENAVDWEIAKAQLRDRAAS